MRRSTPAATVDARTFGVRVRIAVPELGLGAKTVELLHWMDARVGRQGYAVHSSGSDGGGPGNVFLYANDPDAVAECVKAVGLEVLWYPKDTP